jgi:2-oxoglutarate ferredoxin oxidoreductase subunit alpha
MHRLRHLCADVSGFGDHGEKGAKAMKKTLMKGNEALAEGAIIAGCKGFFGYPITPSSEIAEYMAKKMPKAGGVFLQAESEVAAINMVYGGAACGERVMTASSSPGISLKQEGLSYIAEAELPCLVVNVCRGGPGLGAIQAAQSDYFQVTKGGGHGDYHLIVLAPDSVQEMMDFAIEAFRLADHYRNPVMIMADGTMGQMMEPVILREPVTEFVDKPWALTGCVGQETHEINTFRMQGDALEIHSYVMDDKYAAIVAQEKRAETWLTEDADMLVVAFGLLARVAKQAVLEARKQNVKVGLVRPITLWPFPDTLLREAAHQAKCCLVVEINKGQMVEDVKLTLNGLCPTSFYGRIATLPTPEEVLGAIMKAAKEANLA